MTQKEVVIRVVVEYVGEDRYFDAEDVMYLAKDGVDSHYRVVEVSLVTKEECG